MTSNLSKRLMDSQRVMAKHPSFDPQLNPEYWCKVARLTLSLLRNRERPVLVGEVSLWTGMNLKQTTTLLETLSVKNLVRLATDEEIPSKSQSGHAYLLVNPQVIPRGDYDQIPIAILGAPPGT